MRLEHLLSGVVGARALHVLECIGVLFLGRFLVNLSVLMYLIYCDASHNGGLAQLARALAWHARGHRFDPDILHLLVKTERFSWRYLTY